MSDSIIKIRTNIQLLRAYFENNKFAHRATVDGSVKIRAPAKDVSELLLVLESLNTNKGVIPCGYEVYAFKFFRVEGGVDEYNPEYYIPSICTTLLNSVEKCEEDPRKNFLICSNLTQVSKTVADLLRMYKIIKKG